MELIPAPIQLGYKFHRAGDREDFRSTAEAVEEVDQVGIGRDFTIGNKDGLFRAGRKPHSSRCPEKEAGQPVVKPATENEERAIFDFFERNLKERATLGK